MSPIPDEAAMKAIAQVGRTDPQLAQRLIGNLLLGGGGRTKTPPAHTYFIRGKQTGMVKIGAASNPQNRLKELQTGSPEPLELVAVIRGGGLKIEREMHELFAPFRSHGEWFRPNEYVDVAIRVCQADS